MNILKLHIQSDNPVSLEIPEPTDELKLHVVDRILDKVNIFNHITLESELPLSTELQPYEMPEPIKSSNLGIQMPIINEPIPSPVVEDLFEEPKEHDHFVTGYKIKGDKKAYKCRYKCTNHQCGMESNHYIWEGTDEVECHSCGNKLKVKKATPEADLTRDPFGNFYVAGKRQPYYDINKY